MDHRPDVRTLFEEEKQVYFDFSQAPAMITRKADMPGASNVLDDADVQRWTKVQEGFIERSKNPDNYTDKRIEDGKRKHDTFYDKRGPLRGNVLDIGGGWGQHREWWEAKESDVYVVHDPGIERFLKFGPHSSHRRHFRRAFGLPMTFVEGFGEDLPYKEDSFDTCLIAATLDHCADPKKVFAGAYRCLRHGGSILVLAFCRVPRGASDRPHVVKRAMRQLCHPMGLLGRLYTRLFDPPDHLQHFAVADLVMLLERAGFSGVSASSGPAVGYDVYAFAAQK